MKQKPICIYKNAHFVKILGITNRVFNPSFMARHASIWRHLLKTLAKSAMSNGDESLTVDKGRQAGRQASAESHFKSSTAGQTVCTAWQTEYDRTAILQTTKFTEYNYFCYKRQLCSCVASRHRKPRNKLLLLLSSLLLIYSRLLVIGWRSPSKSRSQQQITAIYPSTLQMQCAVLITVIFCSSIADGWLGSDWRFWI